MRERERFNLPWNSVSQNLLQAALLFYLIEFVDELNYSLQAAALPSLRIDLGLDYAQVGWVLGFASLVGALIEPALMLLGDTRWRPDLMLVGGLTIVASLALAAAARSYFPLLLAFTAAYPASGALVTLAQATLMDQNPDRRTQLMARWNLAGSIGGLLGPLLLSAGMAFGISWRGGFLTLAAMGLGLTCLTWRSGLGKKDRTSENFSRLELRDLLPNLRDALISPSLMRWVILLELSDLLLDVYFTYIAFYFVDVIGLSQVQTGLALSGMMLINLLGDLVLIPVLEKAPALSLVRLTALIACLLYPALLLASWPGIKLALAFVLPLTSLGWYPVLQAQAYASLPGRSGTVMAAQSLTGAAGKLPVWLVGWVAAQAGLPAAMWLLLAGPLALVFWVPRRMDPSECSKI